MGWRGVTSCLSSEGMGAPGKPSWALLKPGLDEPCCDHPEPGLGFSAGASPCKGPAQGSLLQTGAFPCQEKGNQSCCQPGTGPAQVSTSQSKGLLAGLCFSFISPEFPSIFPRQEDTSSLLDAFPPHGQFPWRRFILILMKGVFQPRPRTEDARAQPSSPGPLGGTQSCCCKHPVSPRAKHKVAFLQLCPPLRQQKQRATPRRALPCPTRCARHGDPQ